MPPWIPTRIRYLCPLYEQVEAMVEVVDYVVVEVEKSLKKVSKMY